MAVQVEGDFAELREVGGGNDCIPSLQLPYLYRPFVRLIEQSTILLLQVSQSSCCKSIPPKVATVQQPTLETLSNIAYKIRITVVKYAGVYVFLSFLSLHRSSPHSLSRCVWLKYWLLNLTRRRRRPRTRPR